LTSVPSEIKKLSSFSLQEATKVKKECLKPFAYGMPVTSVESPLVILSTGCVVTSGSAQADAKLMANNAFLDRLA
jgi:hypothetical protein